MLGRFHRFFQKPFFTTYSAIFYIWIVTAFILGVSKTLTFKLHNNYQIYKYVFWNILDQFPLFQFQPEHFDDMNHYGPIFGLIIAPFAVLPDVVGGTLWLMFLSVVLFFAIKDLPIKQWQHVAIYWIVFNSLIIAHTNTQFNTITAAMIIFSYTFIRKGNDVWAAFFIILGTFVKLYGIVGFAFFFFSKNKTKLILWSVIWSLVFFALPMAISSPEYIIGQYKAWYLELLHKNDSNNFSLHQNISLLGMVRKATGHFEWSNLPILLSGLALFAIPYLRISSYKQPRFQLLLLSSVLLFTVLFSTGSEPNSYLLSMIGVGIWFVLQPRPLSLFNWFLFLFAMIIGSFAPSDLFPKGFYLKYILPNAFQALPCTLVWLKIVYEMIFEKSHEEK